MPLRFVSLGKDEAATVVGQAGRELKQALVYRAQFLGLHVAPVHRHESRVILEPGQTIDRLHQAAVIEPGHLQIRQGSPREQPIERWQAEPALPVSERSKYN